MLKHSLIALAAMGAGLLGFSGTQASAFTAPPSPVVQSDANPLMVQVRRGGGGMNGGHYNGHYNGNYHGYNRHWNNNNWRYNRRIHGYRCGAWSNRCRYHYGNYWYQNPWWTVPLVGAGVAIGAGVAGAYDGGYGNRHVAWCLNRYQSYNPRYNTWVAYSGAVRQCISPYGP